MIRCQGSRRTQRRVEINGEKEWEVEQALASRIYRGKLQYSMVIGKRTTHDEMTETPQENQIRYQTITIQKIWH
jgi:hypothetical protein